MEVVEAGDEGCTELQGVLHSQRILFQVLVKGSVGMVLKYGPEFNVAIHYEEELSFKRERGSSKLACVLDC